MAITAMMLAKEIKRYVDNMMSEGQLTHLCDLHNLLYNSGIEEKDLVIPPKITYKSGQEGPKHDPYGYDEFEMTVNGTYYCLHTGLSEWLLITARNRSYCLQGFHNRYRWCDDEKKWIDTDDTGKSINSIFESIALISFQEIYEESSYFDDMPSMGDASP